MKSFLTIAFALFITAYSHAGIILVPDTTKNVIEKAKIQYKLSEGKHQYYANNVRGALTIYREVISIDKDNPKAQYGIAECQYSLKNFELAKTHIDMAIKLHGAIDSLKPVDKDVDYLHGNIFFRLGKLDSAIISYQAFKSATPNIKKLEDYDIHLLLKHCEYAKTAMASPVDVLIKNIGENINSSAPEFAPCISLNGKSMVFTSRRPDTKGGMVDVNYDHMYYSDIYISEWSQKDSAWGEAQNLPGKVNTEYHDGGLSFSPIGDLIIYRNITDGMSGATRSGDIYVSKRGKSGKWGVPKEILNKFPKIAKKINSTYFESSASMTADGNRIYFVSERPGGQGQADIYYVEKKGAEWSEPINLGPSINTLSDEKCVFIHPNGEILFFTSNGYEESVGSYDVYYSVKNGDTWSKPKNMGYPINTVKEEKTVSVSADGNTMYVGAYYDIESKGDADIFQIDIIKLGLNITPYVAPVMEDNDNEEEDND
jgi:hypothetical protein